MTDQEEMISRRLADLCRKSEKTGQWQYSFFLTLAEQEHVGRSPLSGRADYHFWGGSETAERKILAAGREEEMGSPAYPISAVQVAPISGKFAEALEHRDYLGALMNLGIERALIGDLTVRDGAACFFCMDSIADYLTDSLSQVRRTAVAAKRLPGDAPQLQPVFQDASFTVASERLDAVVAGFASLSRSQAVALFTASKVMINGRVETDKSRTLQPGDVITVRGTGKAVYRGITRETRKGRLLVTLSRYI